MATTTRKFLTQDERELCEKIAELNIVLISRRARALLMLDDGHTHAKSGELSSLTIGQIRYLLILFKKKGTDLFPEELRATFLQESEVTAGNPGKDVTKEKKNKKKDKKKKKKKETKSSAGKKNKKNDKKKETKSKKKKSKKTKKKKR